MHFAHNPNNAPKPPDGSHSHTPKKLPLTQPSIPLRNIHARVVLLRVRHAPVDRLRVALRDELVEALAVGLREVELERRVADVRVVLGLDVFELLVVGAKVGGVRVAGALQPLGALRGARAV